MSRGVRNRTGGALVRGLGGVLKAERKNQWRLRPCTSSSV